METTNKYSYLLKFSQKERYDLSDAVYNITELIYQDKISHKDKEQFFSVIKTIIHRGDITSYSCVNLLRDIMTDEMCKFMLDELRINIFENDVLSIEIMKIINYGDFTEYYEFLESVKDDVKITKELRKFIKTVLDFHNGKRGYFTFPVINSDENGEIIRIDW